MEEKTKNKLEENAAKNKFINNKDYGRKQLYKGILQLQEHNMLTKEK